MTPVKSLRDLLPGEAHPDEEFSTFQAALAPTEWVAYIDPTAGFTTKMPGDDPTEHPLFANTAENPFPGMGILELLRLIKAGTLDMETDRKARRHYARYMKLTGMFDGDGAYLGRGHAPSESYEQHYADHTTVSSKDGLKRADLFGVDGFTWK